MSCLRERATLSSPIFSAILTSSEMGLVLRSVKFIILRESKSYLVRVKLNGLRKMFLACLVLILSVSFRESVSMFMFCTLRMPAICTRRLKVSGG